MQSSIVYSLLALTANPYRTATDPPFYIYLHDKHVDSWLSRTIAETGHLHGSEEMLLIQTLDVLNASNPGETIRILDIGANIGYMSLLFASRLPLVEIDAFEPYEKHYKLLRRSVIENRFQQKIHLHNVLLGNETSQKCMHQDPQNAASTEVVHSSCSRPHRMFRLDDIVSGYYDLLKIDVEGFEPLVFQGASSILAYRPQFIMMEWIPWRISRHTTEDPVNFLRTLARTYKIQIAEIPGDDEPTVMNRVDRWREYLPHGCNLLLTRRASED